ncbi:glycosyl transferase family 2 [Solidesulfovibrio fructosivorans JJ]]|uniref:Glycosyl transferase family 2 n=1 Tax=Solidesulfovibrio fructosivorans JJ] TaxID=596151 RepID=E1JXN8_SOLFR|nr:glycosyltransferase [Solidesulfovibrio fructosivorans]EFL50811.1 glycosyl transferase family 2 [Solidesulfovibrio fructosivorans JJ]]
MLADPKCPIVTILTPTYNRRAFLPETIESVLGQDYPNIEYLILDDGSSDDTAELVEQYGNSVRYLRHDNMGETKTVNKGFALASGDIVCVVNSDDPLYSDQAVSLAVASLVANPEASMTYPDWVSIDAQSRVLRRMRLPDYTLQNMLEDANVTIGPGMFIRRTAIKKIGLRDTTIKYTGDLDYSFRLAASGKIIHIPKFLATHREHGASASNTCQGADMAREIARLGYVYTDQPGTPEVVRKRRHRILGKWHFIALDYTGNDRQAFREHIKQSFSYSPMLFCWFYLLRLLSRVKKCIFSR